METHPIRDNSYLTESATLTHTNVTLQPVITGTSEEPSLMRIVVAYTLETAADQYVHLYQFYSEDLSPEGVERWADFVRTITRVEVPDSVMFFARRSGAVMQEMVDACMNRVSQSAHAA